MRHCAYGAVAVFDRGSEPWVGDQGECPPGSTRNLRWGSQREIGNALPAPDQRLRES
jgi:hypothetical protein